MNTEDRAGISAAIVQPERSQIEFPTGKIIPPQTVRWWIGTGKPRM